MANVSYTSAPRAGFSSQGSMRIIPQMRVLTRVRPSSSRSEIREMLYDYMWSMLQDRSRMMYGWLTGNQDRYARSLTSTQGIRRHEGSSDHPELLLPDSRETKNYHPAGAPHLRDSVRIVESKQDLRSTVTHAREAYWAWFVEYGTAKMAAQPRWGPAFEVAKQEIYPSALETLQAMLNDDRLSIASMVTAAGMTRI